ncbi:hypothetical protein [Curtobacterium sp. MCBA15_001]|uniref:hypothetical protein n=1 Tax=Curtobacterium sp. MCBA15_001 TaxID=1898731 RepID=UPI0008DD18CD|nr:hypothetical protein [Curtobacterium sp. MCBA15_001]OIH96247.1 hypothetical protein BIU90_00365 [Curtobacterium sp. MCBA15_001]
MSRGELPPIAWTVPGPARRPVLPKAVTVAGVLVLVLAHVAFSIDLHNLLTTPASCEVYCATVPAVEVPALLGVPVCDVLCVVCGVFRLALQGLRPVFGWVLLGTPLLQVAVTIEAGMVLRLLA